MKKYDLKDEDFCAYIEGLCLGNLPIEFYGEYLRHITVKELLLMGEKKYSELIAPFTLTKDIFSGDAGDIYLLEILSLPKLDEYFEFTIEALKLFFNTDNVSVAKIGDSEIEIIINNSLFIDKIKFEELREIILKICNATKLTNDKLDRSKEEKTLTLEQINCIKNKRERDYQMAIYERNNKKNKEKNKSMALYNVYNYVCNSDAVDYEKPLNFNLYQLYNTYNINHRKDSYKYTMRILASGMCSDTKKLDLRPLSQQIVK